ncbi:hypothetical protein RND81_03G066900 [Saponaria officinalis]|uniref:Uncharacterized protein n=1 Tax=Saponaria officinalis TaxID=3572 RepID=A0AAW1M4B0_SAPOF
MQKKYSLLMKLIIILLILCYTSLVPEFACASRQTPNNVFKVMKPKNSNGLSSGLFMGFKPKGFLAHPSGPSPIHNSLGLNGSPPT